MLCATSCAPHLRHQGEDLYDILEPIFGDMLFDTVIGALDEYITTPDCPAAAHTMNTFDLLSMPKPTGASTEHLSETFSLATMPLATSPVPMMPVNSAYAQGAIRVSPKKSRRKRTRIAAHWDAPSAKSYRMRVLGDKWQRETRDSRPNISMWATLSDSEKAKWEAKYAKAVASKPVMPVF